MKRFYSNLDESQEDQGLKMVPFSPQVTDRCFMPWIPVSSDLDIVW